MCCPFAKRCSTFETFVCQDRLHLAWSFCWGEYRDCDYYKCRLSGEAPAEELDLGTRSRLVLEKERILDRLRSSLLDPPARGS